MTGLDIEVIDTPPRTDFRRANGAPMIIDKNGKNQRFSRPSNWGKELDDENALVNWKINRAVEGVAKDPALQARAVSLDPDGDRELWSDLREAAINAGRGAQAADIGTALHKMTERWETEPDYDPGLPYTPFLEAYEKGLTELGLISQRFEFQMVTTEYRTAGTADRLYELDRDLPLPNGEMMPRGSLVIGDIKTGSKLDFSIPAYSIQMSLYAQGEMYDVVTDQFLPTPEINQDWGIIAWIPSKADTPMCEFRWVDLAVGNYGAWLCTEIKDWRKKWRNGTYGAPEIGSDPVHAIVEAGEAALEDAKSPELVEKMVEHAKERLHGIGQNPEAKKFTKLLWPDDIPAPAKITTIEQGHALLVFLDKIEADYGLPFVSGDPRVGEREKGFASKSDHPPA
jgi:hypothetical protein